LDIYIGPLGSETLFHYVNVNHDTVKPKSEHVTCSGEVKVQKAENLYKVFSFEFVYLTKSELAALEVICALDDVLNLQLEDDSFGVDYSIEFRDTLSTWRSRRIPSGYEATIEGVEV
jgi:hypothetical protein